MTKSRKNHYQILANLIRELIRDRFKRLAKDEMLSRFMSQDIDPALLVDHYLQAEREALDLAEISCLELVDSEKMKNELARAARKIQESLQRVYGKKIATDFASDRMVEARTDWLRSRMSFYSRWLTIESDSRTAVDLARDAFKNSKNFSRKLGEILNADRLMNEGILKSTTAMFRLLMKRQMEHEAEQAKELWNEFIGEAFKETRSLPEV